MLFDKIDAHCDDRISESGIDRPVETYDGHAVGMIV